MTKIKAYMWSKLDSLIEWTTKLYLQQKSETLCNCNKPLASSNEATRQDAVSQGYGGGSKDT